MATVIQGELDEILALGSDRYLSMSQQLEVFFKENDVIELRSSGEPFTITYRNRKYTFKPDESLHCSPQLAVDLLQLHGARGTYHGRDPKTMLSKTRYRLLKKEDRELYDEDGVNFRESFIFHFDDRIKQDLLADLKAKAEAEKKAQEAAAKKAEAEAKKAAEAEAKKAVTETKTEEKK